MTSHVNLHNKRLKLVSWITEFWKGRIPEIYKNDILIVNPL